MLDLLLRWPQRTSTPETLDRPGTLCPFSIKKCLGLTDWQFTQHRPLSGHRPAEPVTKTWSPPANTETSRDAVACTFELPPPVPEQLGRLSR